VTVIRSQASLLSPTRLDYSIMGNVMSMSITQTAYGQGVGRKRVLSCSIVTLAAANGGGIELCAGGCGGAG